MLCLTKKYLLTLVVTLF